MSVSLETRKNTWDKIWPVLQKRYKRTATFLDYRNPWELTVAVILSAQTTDDGVNRITPTLFDRFPEPKDFADASVLEIEKYIKTLGYYRSKAKYLKQSAQTLIDEFGGVVPDDENEIQKLSGVGRKSAVAIISNAYNKNIGIPVDTHVIRFVKRFNLSNKKDPSKIEQELLHIIPKKNWKRAGYAIKEYGRKEGKARGYKPEQDPIVQALKK
ncbi:endonuclease III [Candidatus Woesebacteria bacterium]|nr:endonuclease III [Candidatus Woesebacteria bacterium]